MSGFIDASLSWIVSQGTRYPVGGHWAARQYQDNGGQTINDDNVLTPDELRERAHIEESDALLKSYISAARAQVERDTGCALPLQDIAVVYARLEPNGIYRLPMPPTQSIYSAYYMDTDGLVTRLDAVDIVQVLDTNSMPARLTFLPDAFSGLNPPMPENALLLNVNAGWPKETLPPLLKFAVGLLASHYVTQGRDLVNIERGNPMVIPMGYEAAIQAYRLESLA